MDGVSGISTGANEGQNHSASQFVAAAQQLANASASTGNLSIDNINREAVDLLTQQTIYETNSVVVKTANHLLGTLLDVLDIEVRQR